jgi:RimJ/RimL family protein N-acetyltransferase
MIPGQMIQLLPFQRRHVAQTLIWANDAELSYFLDRPRPVAELEHEQWYSQLHLDRQQVYWAVESLKPDPQHLGNVWLSQIDWRHRKAELRILIAHRPQPGIGTETIRLACQYGFERLNLHKIYAYVLDVNPRARRAFEKAGFEVEGTLKADRWVNDAYHDVYLLGLIK